MATTPVDDDFDMPEMTDEILAEFHAPLPEVVAPLIALSWASVWTVVRVTSSLPRPEMPLPEVTLAA